MKCEKCKHFNEGNCYRNGYLKMVQANTRACEDKFERDYWKERIENTTWILDGGQDD